jgi:hypothetical protein
MSRSSPEEGIPNFGTEEVFGYGSTHFGVTMRNLT